MNNNLRKTISIVTLIITLFSIVWVNYCNISYANATTMSEALTDVDTVKTTNASNKVGKIMATIMSIARVAAMTVAVVMLLAIAMKYMYAAPGEKADIKKSATVYVVGAVIAFAVSGILTIISNFAEIVK